MATLQQIISDRRFQTLDGNKKRKALSMAEDAPDDLKNASGLTGLRETFMPGNEANARNFRMAAGNPLAEAGATQDPVATSKMVPAAMGVLGAISPIKFGTALGTTAGRQLSNAMLKGVGHPEEIPSGVEQGVETLGALAMDAIPLPLIKSKLAGKAIGAAERAAGITQDAIRRLPPPSSIRTSVVLLNKLKDRLAGGEITPMAAREIKPALDTIANRGWLNGTEYISDFGQVSKRISELVNKIPGRGEAASQMRSAMAIPNMAKKTWKAIPNPVRRGFGYALGGGLAVDALREVLGERGGR